MIVEIKPIAYFENPLYSLNELIITIITAMVDRIFKIILIISALLFLEFGYFAYGQDSFSVVDSLVGKRVVLYDASGLLNEYGPYMYMEQKGKLKVVKDVSQYNQAFDNGRVLEVQSQEIVKKKKYLLLTSDGISYYILIDGKKNYLNNVRSYSFWEDKLSYFQDNFQLFLIHGADAEDHPSNHYKLIYWSGFKMPESFTTDVQFFYYESDILGSDEANEKGAERSLPSEAIRLNASKYISKETYNSLVTEYLERKENERLDSLADLRPIIAKVLHTYDAKNTYKKVDIKYDDGDDNEIRLYLCNTTVKYGKTSYTFSGYSLGNDLTFNDSDLKFINPAESDYLKRRGSNGISVRKKIAKDSDLEYSSAKLDSLQAELDKLYQKVQKMYSFYDKKKIFITGHDYVFGDYGQFGMSFELYNCYSQPIKYVEIKMAPYNAVDDVQTDDMGRGTREVRCIGPIEPKESATYKFEKLWWDERDIIRRVDIIRVKLIFKDNSSIIFPSKSKVDARRSSNYSLLDMGITE